MIIVLFDIDGTLINGEQFWRQLFIRSLEQTTKKPFSDFNFNLTGKSDAEIIYHLAKNTVSEKKLIPQTESRIKKYYLNNFIGNSLRSNFSVLPSARNTLIQLQSKKIQLGLVTGNFRFSALNKLRSKNLEHFFDLNISSFCEANSDRIKLLESSIEKIYRLHGNDNQIWYVGDTINDVVSANKLKINSVGIGKKFCCLSKLATQEKPNVYLSSWRKSNVLIDQLKNLKVNIHLSEY